MTHKGNLPAASFWRFDEIRNAEPQRAEILENATSPSALLDDLREQLRLAVRRATFRLGLEQSESNQSDLRATVQFPVTCDLFDCLFNSRIGYRAHFLAHFECGLRYNESVVELLRVILASEFPDVASGRLLDGKYRDLGAVTATTRDFLLRSFSPALSKLWFCAMLIEREGGTITLPTGLTGPRIILADGRCWPAPYQDGPEAWLDFKSAFVGAAGLYQPKDPLLRAQILHKEGSA